MSGKENNQPECQVLEMYTVQDPRQPNRTEFSTPVIVEIYSEYIRCNERKTPALDVLKSSVRGERSPN